MLIETSAWIEFLKPKNKKRDEKIVAYIRNHLMSGKEVYTTPLIIQEVLQGFSDEDRYSKVLRSFESYDIFQFEDQFDAAVKAANIYRQCRLQGSTIRSPNDCMIALVALEFNLPLLHKDKDFDFIKVAFPALKIVDYS